MTDKLVIPSATSIAPFCVLKPSRPKRRISRNIPNENHKRSHPWHRFLGTLGISGYLQVSEVATDTEEREGYSGFRYTFLLAGCPAVALLAVVVWQTRRRQRKCFNAPVSELIIYGGNIDSVAVSRGLTSLSFARFRFVGVFVWSIPLVIVSCECTAFN